ncbi:MAG: PIN/TRAM domain-containing protein [Thermanaeromonas sp.]|uniref:PIN/TRAM domain-containing protein n=1 Tax=Thermanaeromonas sp. TaxID=2003697 RepID=UPI00243EB049|nr:PIN/TRAM domain-containing protein [Thermanaeromonas sp.]MCG0277087.1 PIN/TRAM domain-containing protein [Thermanaeromonas sp.]
MLYLFFRGVISLVGGALGFALAQSVLSWWVGVPPGAKYSLIALATLLAALAGFVVSRHLIEATLQLVRRLENKLQRLSAQEIVSGAMGLILGLIIANLLGASFIHLPWVGPYVPMAASILFGYLGWSLGTKRREELWGLFSFFKLTSKDKSKGGSPASSAKILDTSVIIDGRIADIIRTGFLEGTIIVPSFVLEELRHIADSSDVLKRNRGRRGLDMLNKIRKELGVNVKIYEEDFEDAVEVDTKLVRLAQKLKAPILTNDYNLNKVAELHGVKVLNINELANAVKPIVLPGEEMTVQVIKDGKEAGQGVGYLDDGTMIVVENGRRFIGQSIAVLVTSVLQTSAGRMIFARPKAFDKKNNQHQSLERGEYQCLS